MSPDNSTADYRKYPKGPNFLGIVIASGIVILLILGAALLFLTDYGKHLLRHVNPQSSIQAPGPRSAELAINHGHLQLSVSALTKRVS